MTSKSEIAILVAIATIVGAIFLKLKKVPWWLVIIGSAVGGVMGFFALDETIGDALLGAAAGAIGPYLISTAIDGAKSFIRRKFGSPEAVEPPPASAPASEANHPPCANFAPTEPRPPEG